MTDAVTTDLCALAARVEALTGPDREMDAEINLMVFTTVSLPDAPPYTASLDAAMSLVPDNCNWACGDLNENNQPWACVTDQVDAVDHEGTAATAILAAVAAALRARAQQSGQG